jgi:hypothetical protein
MHSDRNGHDVPVILLYSTENPDAPPVRLVNEKETKWVRTMEFIDETKFFAFCGLSSEEGYVVWDTTTGKEIRSCEGEAAVDIWPLPTIAPWLSTT